MSLCFVTAGKRVTKLLCNTVIRIWKCFSFFTIKPPGFLWTKRFTNERWRLNPVWVDAADHSNSSACGLLTEPQMDDTSPYWLLRLKMQGDRKNRFTPGLIRQEKQLLMKWQGIWSKRTFLKHPIFTNPLVLGLDRQICQSFHIKPKKLGRGANCKYLSIMKSSAIRLF